LIDPAQNIFVGLALGTADNDHALFIAIIFHQFFEGLGLGSRVADVDMRKIASILLIDFVFAASAPVGIGIGLGVKSALEDGSMAYSTVDGTFQALTPSDSPRLVSPQCTNFFTHLPRERLPRYSRR
jgi:zinc transporter 1/2/3